MLKHIFVYGTLKQGQCREAYWPLPPELVRPAWTLGELYDTGPYPALLPGTDAVAGEIWSYPEQQAATVLQRLDQIEGTNQAGCSNEYDRELVQVQLLSGEQLQATPTSMPADKLSHNSHASFQAANGATRLWQSGQLTPLGVWQSIKSENPSA